MSAVAAKTSANPPSPMVKLFDATELLAPISASPATAPFGSRRRIGFGHRQAHCAKSNDPSGPSTVSVKRQPDRSGHGLGTIVTRGAPLGVAAPARDSVSSRDAGRSLADLDSIILSGAAKSSDIARDENAERDALLGGRVTVRDIGDADRERAAGNADRERSDQH